MIVVVVVPLLPIHLLRHLMYHRYRHQQPRHWTPTWYRTTLQFLPGNARLGMDRVRLLVACRQSISLHVNLWKVTTPTHTHSNLLVHSPRCPHYREHCIQTPFHTWQQIDLWPEWMMHMLKRILTMMDSRLHWAIPWSHPCVVLPKW